MIRSPTHAQMGWFVFSSTAKVRFALTDATTTKHVKLRQLDAMAWGSARRRGKMVAVAEEAAVSLLDV